MYTIIVQQREQLILMDGLNDIALEVYSWIKTHVFEPLYKTVQPNSFKSWILNKNLNRPEINNRRALKMARGEFHMDFWPASQVVSNGSFFLLLLFTQMVKHSKNLDMAGAFDDRRKNRQIWKK